ncbi:MAG: Mammalian cell entry related domain protein [Solirubrobacterales bacterium]|nr:Mammalian cell entry related domain protein [Solirubrobacterales bacterium]
MSARGARFGRRRRREHARPAEIILSGLLVLAVIGVFVALALRSPRGLPLLGYRTYYAVVPDTGNMRVHGEVRTGGVRVGEVTGIGVDHGKARLRLKMDPGAGSFPADTQAEVRGKGLLGARYLALIPGHSAQTLESGAVIGPGKEPITLSVPDALDTFDRQTRGGLHSVVTELGRGVLGRGSQLNDAIRAARPASDQWLRLTSAILARPGSVRRLVPSFAGASTALDASKNDLVAMFRPATNALLPFADHRAQTQAALDVAPPALAAAQPAFVEGRRLLSSIQALAAAANHSLPLASGALSASNRLLTVAPPALRAATPLLRQVPPTAGSLIEIAGALKPELDQLRRGFDALLPQIQQIAKHACAWPAMASNWRSMLGQGAPNGSIAGPLNTLRVEPVISPEALAGFLPLPKGAGKIEAFPKPCAWLPKHHYSPGNLVGTK